MRRNKRGFGFSSLSAAFSRLSRSGTLLCLTVALLLLLSNSTHSIGLEASRWSSGQPVDRSSDPQQRPSDKIELSAELVVLNVAVVDQANHPITDLTKDDFIVHEDDVQQQIVFFNEEETPTSIGLVIDTSGSMRRKLNKVIAAGLRLIRESHHQDEVFVVQFNDEIELIQDFTNNIDEVQEALEDMVAHSQTKLLDAVYLSVDHAQGKGMYQRKAIVLITDGEERDSYWTQPQVLEKLRETEVEVYAVGFPEGLDVDRYNIFRGTGKRKIGRRERRARKLLDQLTYVSGGRAFYPESLSQLDAIAQTIARELRMQYVIGYYPTNSKRDGTWRKVRVVVKPGQDGGRRIARTRPGYYANPHSEAKKSP